MGFIGGGQHDIKIIFVLALQKVYKKSLNVLSFIKKKFLSPQQKQGYTFSIGYNKQAMISRYLGYNRQFAQIIETIYIYIKASMTNQKEN